MARTIGAAVLALCLEMASVLMAADAGSTALFRSNCLGKAMEMIAKIPEKHQVILELALVPVRKQMGVDAETLVRTLDDVRQGMTSFPKESWYRKSTKMIDLYLELGALTNACRMLPGGYVENAAAVAMYCLKRRNEAAFRYAFGEMLRCAKENEGSLSSHACYNLGMVAECAATNGFPKIALEVFGEAKRFAGAARSFEAFMREKGLESGEKFSKEERRELLDRWKMECEELGVNRVLNLCEVAEREHYSGLEKEGRATMRKVIKEASSLEKRSTLEDDDSLILRGVLSRAISIQEYNLAEPVISTLRAKRDRVGLRAQILETKGCFGEIEFALQKLAELLKHEEQGSLGGLDGCIFRIASTQFRAQKFEQADLLIDSISDPATKDQILGELVENQMRAGNREDAKRALSRIADKKIASDTEEMLSKTKAEAPVSIKDQIRYVRAGFCGTAEVAASQFRDDVVSKFDPPARSSMARSGSLARIRSIGRAIGMEPLLRSDLLEYWQPKFEGSDLRLAYFYVGLCEGIDLPYFYPAYDESDDPREN